MAGPSSGSSSSLGVTPSSSRSIPSPPFEWIEVAGDGDGYFEPGEAFGLTESMMKTLEVYRDIVEEKAP